MDESNIRPLAVNPNTPIQVVFTALGNKPPRPNPDSPRTARYSYGADLKVDAINGLVYAITLRIPNRSWRGLYAGMDQQKAEGTLARLGTPREEGSTDPPARVISDYVTYPSLEDRPKRTLRAEVRPPNGCFDVIVDLQPQAIGLLQDGEERFAVVARVGDAYRWVVTQIRVVSRSMTGPYAAGPSC
jgi:hypothetical protein